MSNKRRLESDNFSYSGAKKFCPLDEEDSSSEEEICVVIFRKKKHNWQSVNLPEELRGFFTQLSKNNSDENLPRNNFPIRSRTANFDENEKKENSEAWNELQRVESSDCWKPNQKKPTHDSSAKNNSKDSDDNDIIAVKSDVYCIDLTDDDDISINELINVPEKVHKVESNCSKQEVLKNEERIPTHCSMSQNNDPLIAPVLNPIKKEKDNERNPKYEEKFNNDHSIVSPALNIVENSNQNGCQSKVESPLKNNENSHVLPDSSSSENNTKDDSNSNANKQPESEPKKETAPKPRKIYRVKRKLRNGAMLKTKTLSNGKFITSECDPRKLHGIGKEGSEKLRLNGIKNIGDLKRTQRIMSLSSKHNFIRWLMKCLKMKLTDAEQCTKQLNEIKWRL